MIVVGFSQPFRRRFPCWLLFTLAVYATPFFAGVTAALAAFNYGAGVIGALIVGLVASVVTLVASQAAFAVVKSPNHRGSRRDRPPFFGACGRRGVSRDTRTHTDWRLLRIWRDLFAVIGGVIVGCTAFVRLARTANPTSHERSIVLISAQQPSPPLAPSTQGIDVGHLHLPVG